MRIRWRWTAGLVTILLLVGPTPGPVPAASAGCRIVEGASIAGVQIGMAVSAALAITSAPLRQHPSDGRIVYTLRPPLHQMVVHRGVVERMSTRSPDCRTAHGVGPGTAAAEVRGPYSTSPISVLRRTPDGDLLSYPFAGVAFLLREDRVLAVEVFAAESLGQPSAPAVAPPRGTPGIAPAAVPTPTPAAATAPGSWSVRSLATRVEESALIVTGTVENRDRPLNAYAEVRLLDAAGQPVGGGESPLQPNPIPVGGTATFEVRIPVDQVVRRYVVFIRPFGSTSAVLTQATGEIKDLHQFAAMVARQVTAQIRATSALPDRSGFVVVVTNGSGLAIESATVSVQMTVTCRVAGRPDPLLIAGPFSSPPPTPRTLQETWTGTAVVRSIGPRASSEVPVQLSGGVCVAFTTWSASVRVTDVRIAP
jgi:hypothetical protein